MTRISPVSLHTYPSSPARCSASSSQTVCFCFSFFGSSWGSRRICSSGFGSRSRRQQPLQRRHSSPHALATWDSFLECCGFTAVAAHFFFRSEERRVGRRVVV